jgi:signal transduction histidine kinase
MNTSRLKLLPRALLSVPVFGLSLLWVVIVQVGEWAAAGEGLGTLFVRLASLVAAQFIMFAFPFATWRLVCPRVRTQIWTWLLLASVILGAAVRGVVLGYLLFLFGAANSPELLFRVLASLTHLAVITVLLWFLVSEVRELHARRWKLVAEREQLVELQRTTEREWERLNERATEETRRLILESVDWLQSTDWTELRQRLRFTIEDVVRPLSHKLAAQASTWAPPQLPMEPMGVNWPLAAREGLDPVRIHPVIVPILLIWLGLPIHLFRFGPTLTAGFVATLIVAIPAFWLARKVAIRLSAGQGAATKAAAFVGAVLVGGVALGLATVPYMQAQPQPLLFVMVTPILALLISGPLAIAEAARDQNLELESELKATAEHLRWTLARARERNRQQEGALAHALHGRLQASLTAAFLRLDRAAAQGANNDALLEALQAEILRAVFELEAVNDDPQPIERLIELTESNWFGAVDLRFTLDQQVQSVLTGDPLCARSVNDLIPELVFNSVRHGHASAIEVKLEIIQPGTLALSVSDDGSDEGAATQCGLGSRLLDEASITWSRARDGKGTTTTCLLPCLSPNSSLVTRWSRGRRQPRRNDELPPPVD